MQQHEFTRMQVRLPEELYAQLKEICEKKRLSLNQYFLEALEQAVRFEKRRNRRLIYNDWNTKRSSTPDFTDDYILRAADEITAFLAKHPQYEVVTVETKKDVGLRLWYTYPVDENGRGID
jgi:ribbon-helix-helix protein, copG family